MKSIGKKLLNLLLQSYQRMRLGGLGKGAMVAFSARLSFPRKIFIGQDCRIADHAVLRANTDEEVGIFLANGVSVHESALIGANNGSVTIGERSWVAPFCLIYGNGKVTLGKDVLLGPRVSINTVSHHSDNLEIPINDQGIFTDPVVIEDDVWIGMHAVILQGVTIGRGSIIGAGSVVNTDIPPWSVAVGAPAKVIRSRK